MAEYNVKYLELKRRLKILKLLNDTDMSLSEDEKNRKGSNIDNLLKDLDNRYSEGLFLDEIESLIEILEKE